MNKHEPLILHEKSLDDVTEKVYGAGVSVSARRRVSGGDINDAYLISLSDGQKVFLKENSASNEDFFRAETEGLDTIAQTGAIGVPCPHAYGTCGGKSFLLMEYIGSAREARGFWEDFGHALSTLHMADTKPYTGTGRYGFIHDNYIGAGPQDNSVKDTWVDFFRECRILKQFERAKDMLPGEDAASIERLMSHLSDYIPEPDRPSLIHGDLWGGNFITGPHGQAMLIDPAVYVGSAEADIAMTQLFGGFAHAFYDSYKESGLIKPGYSDRRDIYNLYHMLNHVNLFGPMYLGSVHNLVSRY